MEEQNSCYLNSDSIKNRLFELWDAFENSPNGGMEEVITKRSVKNTPSELCTAYEKILTNSIAFAFNDLRSKLETTSKIPSNPCANFECETVRKSLSKMQKKYKDLKVIFSSLLKQTDPRTQTSYLSQLRLLEHSVGEDSTNINLRESQSRPSTSVTDDPSSCHKQDEASVKTKPSRKLKVVEIEEGNAVCPPSDSDEHDDEFVDTDTPDIRDRSTSPEVFLRSHLSSTPEGLKTPTKTDNIKKRIPMSPINSTASSYILSPQSKLKETVIRSHVQKEVAKSNKENYSKISLHSKKESLASLNISSSSEIKVIEDDVLFTPLDSEPEVIPLTPVRSLNCSINESHTSPSVLARFSTANPMVGSKQSVCIVETQTTNKSTDVNTTFASSSVTAPLNSKIISQSSSKSGEGNFIDKSHYRKHAESRRTQRYRTAHSGRMKQATLKSMVKQMDSKKPKEKMDITGEGTFTGGKRLSGGSCNTSFEDTKSTCSSSVGADNSQLGCVNLSKRKGQDLTPPSEAYVRDNENSNDAEGMVPLLPSNFSELCSDDYIDLKKKSKTKDVEQNDDMNDLTMKYAVNFDRVPKLRKSPNSKRQFKGPVVRNKAERAQMYGTTCRDCIGYYKMLESQMNPEEINKLVQKCSKHREVCKVDMNYTPEDFWNTSMPSTVEMRKMIPIVQPSPVRPRRRRIFTSSESEGEN